MCKKYLKDIPHLDKEYNFEKNIDLDFDKLTHGSGKKAWWKCNMCKEKWQVSPNQRTFLNKNCPYCNGQKVSKKNNLAVTHPHLLKEWSNKNKVKPEEVTVGSENVVWWKCKKGHEWKTKISCRKNHNCPYCSGNKVCEDNCLKTTHPELSKEWASNNLSPKNITSGSNKKINWKCKKCKYVWKATPNNRANLKSGCPKCNESKGEKIIEQFIIDLEIRFKREHKFSDFKKYRFDFALFEKYKKKPFAVIEYHGTQHYEPVRFGGISLAKAKENLVSCKKRDLIKKQYCLNNNIKYLEIPYSEKENIKQLIKDFL